ncbi:hypothetical protein [Absidia glauca]|uniref:Glutathione S-transferase 3, mitochondrial n=1 Tax=Absidia glauca TaxID=4829 RepID=A0A168NTJ0_ABSGL|nr:hypothetical protein [Absidia glauca]
MSIVVPSEYGYVLAASAANALHLGWLALGVGAARRKAGIPYPYLYAERSEAEKDKVKHLFNCAQRAHQNTLEMFPLVNTLLLIGGLCHPKLSASASALYMFGRILYAWGYKTGNPDSRFRGLISYLGLFALMYSTGSSLHTLLK